MDAYIHFGHYIVSSIASALSLYFSASILCKKICVKHASSLAPTLTLYVSYVFVLSLLLFINCIYLTIWWRRDFNVYDARILFALGGGSSLILITYPLLETILCIDRCLRIKFPTIYDIRKKQILCIFATTVILGINIWIFVQSSLITNFPASPATNCRLYYCIGFILNPKLTLLFKSILSVLNILLSCLLYFLFKWQTSDKTQKRANTNIILMTISTIFIDFVPLLLGQIFFYIFNTQVNVYIGPYWLTLGCINVTVCMGLCYQVSKKSVQSVFAILPGRNVVS